MCWPQVSHFESTEKSNFSVNKTSSQAEAGVTQHWLKDSRMCRKLALTNLYKFMTCIYFLKNDFGAICHEFTFSAAESYLVEVHKLFLGQKLNKTEALYDHLMFYLALI